MNNKNELKKKIQRKQVNKRRCNEWQPTKRDDE